MREKKANLIAQKRVFFWITFATVLLLTIPFVATQFTTEVNWEIRDFILMGMLLFSTGSFYVCVARILPRQYRTLTGIIILVVFLLIWIHLAVGIVNTWPLAGS